MSDVTLTAALRSNLLRLQSTQKLLDSTQLRLATGKKVNSALENATAFFASQTLLNRADDLSFLLDGQGQAIQVIKAADIGITSLQALTEQAKSIAQSARDTVTNSGAFRSGDLTSALSLNTGAIATTLNLTSGSGATLNVVVANRSLTAIAADINASASFSAIVVEGTTGATAGNKRLEIRATGGNTLAIANNAAGTFFNSNNGGVGGTAGRQVSLNAAYVLGNNIATTLNTPDQIALENQYNTVRTQIDQIISDSGYRGTNLLNGDTLAVKFNEDNSSNLSVSGVTFNTTGLGISTAAFQSSTNIDSAISETGLATGTLRVQAQSFGNALTIIQSRESFTNNLINTLKEGSDKLVLADKNEEGANLLALQTAQELGITALSLASQAAQSVLRLFQ